MALGQGLGALFEDNSVTDNAGVAHVRLSEIEPNRAQPRKNFDEASIQSLAESIREHGLIQPIVVRRSGMGYKIVAGERRWRACRMLGLDEISVIIKDFDDFKSSQIALIENIQREDLNPIEEAEAYRELMQTYGMTQDKLAKSVGKSRSVIANALRLLDLPDAVKDLLVDGRISVGHGKILAGIDDDNTIIRLAESAADGQLSVRQLEKRVFNSKKTNVDIEYDPLDEPTDKSMENFCTEMEITLSDKLGRKVKIHSSQGGVGSISFDFYDKDDLINLAVLIAGE